ncbi:hypothetical protein GGR58DRAFT_218294 [Xylaria digitata]|nr:hypothetical protein GGR58DRAFT_218294 [Xylaria digitata]
MPQQGYLHLVRIDHEHVVFTQHPDYIHPPDLSALLRGKYGDSKVQIYLVMNIYVIYVDRDAVDTSNFSPPLMTDSGNTQRKPKKVATLDWQQKLADIKQAQEVLIKSKVSGSRDSRQR